MAAAAAVVQVAYGNVRAGYGLAIGLPAVGGVLVGTWLQQRIPTHRITLGFAALLVAVAVQLLL